MKYCITQQVRNCSNMHSMVAQSTVETIGLSSTLKQQSKMEHTPVQTYQKQQPLAKKKRLNESMKALADSSTGTTSNTISLQI